VTTLIYLQVSVSQILTLFSCRTGEAPFFFPRPSRILALAAGLSLLASSLIAAFLPSTTWDEQAVEGLGLLTVFVWLYCLIWFFIQDLLKVVAFKLLRRFQVFGYGKPLALRGVDPNRLTPRECVSALSGTGLPPDIAEIVASYYHGFLVGDGQAELTLPYLHTH